MVRICGKFSYDGPIASPLSEGGVHVMSCLGIQKSDVNTEKVKCCLKKSDIAIIFRRAYV